MSGSVIVEKELAKGGPGAQRCYAGEGVLRRELNGIFQQSPGKILATYLLLNVENVLRLCQPFLLGWAVNDLLAGSQKGLIAMAIGHVAFMGLRLARQVCDTRTFTEIYRHRAGQLVLRQRARGVDTSRVAARAGLVRHFVTFFEVQIPLIVQTAYSCIGALVMLALYAPTLVAWCAALALPAAVLNLAYGRRALRLSGRLHDAMENEVQVIDRAGDCEVQDHYHGMARSRVRLSDVEAVTVGLMELFVLALLTATLLFFCAKPGVSAGDIFAVFRYVLLFVGSLDAMPGIVESLGRLRDIGRRL